MKQFEFTVVGVQYRMEDYAKAKVKTRDILELVAEPTNKYDRNAIKVLKSGIHFGYIPRNYNESILADVRAGKTTCAVTAVFPEGCCIKVDVDEEEDSRH